MAPPIDPRVDSYVPPPPGLQPQESPLAQPQAHSGSYRTNHITPEMFGVRSWEEAVRNLSSQQRAALWAWIQKMDTPLNATRFAGRRVQAGQTLQEAIRRTQASLPDQPAPAVQPQASDPNALDPNEINSPDPRIPYKPGQPESDDRGGQTPYVEPPVIAQPPDTTVPETPYVETPTIAGGSGTANANAAQWGQDTAETAQRLAAYNAQNSAGWSSKNPNTPPPMAATPGKRWTFDTARGSWVQAPLISDTTGLADWENRGNPNVRPLTPAAAGREWYWDQNLKSWQQKPTYAQQSSRSGSPRVRRSPFESGPPQVFRPSVVAPPAPGVRVHNGQTYTWNSATSRWTTQAAGYGGTGGTGSYVKPPKTGTGSRVMQ